MDSEQGGCIHEERRIAIIIEMKELEEEKKELKKDFDEIDQSLNDIKEYFERGFDFMPNVILETIRDKEEELMNDQARLGNEMTDVRKEIADCLMNLHEEKEWAEEDKCCCVKNF